jgi:hypothetical protein
MGLASVFGVLTPILLAVGGGYYSAVRQCNQDASDVETRLTSTLLEISDREARMKSVLAPVLAPDHAAPVEKLILEITQTESGVDGHYGDPAFKDYTLISLVNQYNRLLRRVQFSPDQPSTDAILNIDTQNTHPAIETLSITKKGCPHLCSRYR